MTDCNETHENRPKIELSLNSIGVIISFPSGVIYQNITCGHACIPRCEEGVLMLLTDPLLLIGAPAEVYYCPIEAKLKAMEWWSILYLSPTIASEVDKILHDYPMTKGISVDYTRLQESAEAWIYVNIEPTEFAVYSHFGACKGILVWANSD